MLGGTRSQLKHEAATLNIRPGYFRSVVSDVNSLFNEHTCFHLHYCQEPVCLLLSVW